MIRLMKNILHEIMHSQYVKNLFILTSGVGLSQLIPLLLLPLLTRFFSPVEFGVLALFLAIVQLLSTTTTFRLEMAVLLPKKDSDAAILCLISFFTLFTSVLLISFLFLILSSCGVLDSIKNILFNNNVHELYTLLIYLIPLGILLMGCYNILYSWNNRLELYKNMSYSHLVHSFLSTPLAIVLSFSSLQFIALILGQIIGRFLACFLLIKSFFNIISEISKSDFLNKSKVLLSKYRKFIFFETPHSILNFVSQKYIIAFFTAFFGLFTVGIFDLSDKILGKPLGIISNSFKTVFYKRLTTAKDKISIFKKSILLMTVISFVLTTPFYLIPDTFFIVLLGQEWSDTGRYIQLICPLLFSRFVFNVVTPAISYTLQNHFLLIWQIFYMICLVLLFSIVQEFNVEKVLFVYSIFGALMYVVLGWIAFLVLKKHIQK
ncbi:MAG: hypothetical protein CMD26_02115 [Flavobacteriales bacterium]|nr:hypothetical protein [Flavobacteriales bacterium]|tara:strand:+ start:4827 stop:6128 length:1302 start_codon:yes stop_codon:yes gene_type:complete